MGSHGIPYQRIQPKSAEKKNLFAVPQDLEGLSSALH
jgi:hypothetical protein